MIRSGRSLPRNGFALLLLALGPAAALVAGCSIGPQTVPRDRVGYGDALAESARSELLLNIVRIRYLESPVFLSINSVVNQYSLESQVNAGAGWNWGADTFPSSSSSLGATSRFADRPTITYAPMVGKQFTETLIAPIRPESVLALVESGWNVGGLFPLTVHSINGIRNRFHVGRTRQELDPQFQQIVELLTEMQQDGMLSIRVQKATEEDKPSFVFIFTGRDDPAADERIKVVKDLLGLRPDADRYRIVFGSMARDDTEIALVTRSILAILADMSSYIRVPEEHVADGRAVPGAPRVDGLEHPLTIHFSETEPADAYVKVHHRDLWFYVDDRDIHSKRTFLMLILLSTLAESSEAAQAPLLTIPAG